MCPPRAPISPSITGTEFGFLVTPRWLSRTAVLCALPILACGEGPNPLLGEWVSVGSDGPRMVYVFGEISGGEGASKWFLDVGEGPDTLEIVYRTDLESTPAQLDIGPWSGGPLDGRTLFGIVEIQGPDRFRVDFEAGEPGAGGAERPTEFTAQTVTFVRKRN